MLLHKLLVRDFRPFEQRELLPGPGVNLIVGANAVGKTSLLEALYLLVTGSSFRAKHAKELVREGAEGCQVEAHFEKASVPQQLHYTYFQEEKRVRHNGNFLPHAGGLLGLLPGVLLAPQDIELIRGAPLVRRRYLDLQLAQVDPLYVHHLIRYKKALKQRNALLKRGQTKLLGLFEEPLAHSASYLVGKRLEIIRFLEERVSRNYREITGKEDIVTLAYLGSSDCTPAYYLQEFQRQRKRELEVGHTLTGPHKDDLALFLKEKDAKWFGSEGEVRSLSAALKLAEWEAICEQTGEKPLLLIDDFALSFDQSRAHAFASRLTELGQVLITATDDCKNNFKNFNIELVS